MLPFLSLVALPLVAAWLPVTDRELTSSGKNLFNSKGTIRGVSSGSHFVFEPWMASSTWNSMGCGNQTSEFDCVSALGQDKANSVFQNHWKSWLTQDDINSMTSYGLNTLRIPIGYWLDESIVYNDSEHFPQGGLPYLQSVCGMAANAGMFVILDLHGVPDAQVAENPDTGQYAPKAGFYNDGQYERALQFLEFMTNKIHITSEFRSVGLLNIVNEPIRNTNQVPGLTSSYYPNAFSRIRTVEKKLNKNDKDYLHIQMMNQAWGSGDPNPHLSNKYYAAYDDHRYLKFVDSSNPVDYMNISCNDNRGGNWPTIVGEFCISPNTKFQNSSSLDMNSHKQFYKQWFAAQARSYEKQQGWIFWAWKAELNDYRWSYSEAVAANVIPRNPDDIYSIGGC